MNQISDDKQPLFPAGRIDGDWEREEDPPKNQRVFALARDDRGEYAITFPVIFTDDDVINAQTRTPLAPEVQIAAWRV